jgi:hypothetical protein
MNRIVPGYSQGFARSSSESQSPELWDGLVGAWVPGLGVTGDTLFDWSGKRRHGIFGGTKGGEYFTWGMNQGGYSLLGPAPVGNGALANIAIGDWVIPTGRISIVARVSKITGASPTDRRIISRASSTTSDDHDWMIGSVGSQATQFRSRFFIDGTTHTDISDGIVFDNDHNRFLAATYDGANVHHYHYRQGASSDSTPVVHKQWATTGDLIDTDRGPQTVEIGRNPGGTPYGNWEGLIYFVYVYDRALSPGEIDSLFSDNYAPFRMRRQLVARGIGSTGINAAMDTVVVGHKLFATSWHPNTWKGRP